MIKRLVSTLLVTCLLLVMPVILGCDEEKTIETRSQKTIIVEENKPVID